MSAWEGSAHQRASEAERAAHEKLFHETVAVAQGKPVPQPLSLAEEFMRKRTVGMKCYYADPEAKRLLTAYVEKASEGEDLTEVFLPNAGSTFSLGRFVTVPCSAEAKAGHISWSTGPRIWSIKEGIETAEKAVAFELEINRQVEASSK